MDVSFKDSRAPVTETISPPEWLMDAALMRIHAGALPRELQSKVMAGPGRRQICALCDHLIEPGDVNYRVTPDGATAERPYLHFHVCCYRAWVKACGSMPRANRRTPTLAARFPDSKRSGP